MVMTEVRDATGSKGGNSYADVIAVSTWPSRGYRRIGCEIKVSRSDVLRELRNPAKATWWQERCHSWYLVVGHSSLVSLDELPPTWGLIVPHRNTLRVAKQAPEREPKPLAESTWISMLRNAYKDNPEKRVLDEVFAAGKEAGRAAGRNARKQLESKLERIQEAVSEFEAASGIRLSEWTHSELARMEGAALKALRKVGYQAILKRASDQIRVLEDQARRIKEAFEEIR